MKKADKSVVIIRDNTVDVNVNYTNNSAPSQAPAYVVIAKLVFTTIIVLAVAYYCPENLAEIIPFVCLIFSKHSDG